MKWLFIASSLIFSSTVFAENTASWWQLWKSTDEVTGVSDQLFTASDKAVLREYLRTQSIDDSYENHYENNNEESDKKHKKKKHKDKKKKTLPPGLQKKVARGGQLPPGWQKKVARGEVLDADLYDASEKLPNSILDQLEHVQDTSVRQIDDRIIRIMDSTDIILDVLTSN